MRELDIPVFYHYSKYYVWTHRTSMRGHMELVCVDA
jgi:hypothetical protein